MTRVPLVAMLAVVCSALVLAQNPPVPSPTVRPGTANPGAQVPGLPPPRDAARAPQTGTARIRGRVVGVPGGAPLRRAQVVVTVLDSQVRRLTTTDAEGRFEFVELPAGRLGVGAGKAGYVGLQYGQRRPFEAGTPIVIAEGQTLTSIDISLPRGSVIDGRVTDEFGEPIAGAQVQVQRFQYGPDGQRRLATTQVGTSNDRGDFRVYGLMPGDYVVSAEVRLISALTSTPNANDSAEGFAPMYYPGTLNSAEAQPIVLGVGEEKTVQFSLIASRLARISGTAMMSDGRPATGAQVMMLGRQNATSILSGGMVASNGAFSVAGVAAGEYTIQIRMMGRGGSTPNEFATVPIDVGSANVDNLRIVTGRGATVTGRVVFEGTSPRTGSPAPLRVFPQPATPAPGIVLSTDTAGNGTLDDAGNFELGGVSGSVFFTLGLPGWVIKSVTLDGDDITDTPVDVTGRESLSNLVLTMTDKLTDISGRVTDSRGQALTDYVVVILPAEAKEPTIATRWIRTVRPNTDGRYQIRGARPGRYVAAAIESLEQGRQFAPEFQQRLRQSAREFTVRDGETVTVDLRLIPDI